MPDKRKMKRYQIGADDVNGIPIKDGDILRDVIGNQPEAVVFQSNGNWVTGFGLMKRGKFIGKVITGSPYTRLKEVVGNVYDNK